ncbi:Trehalose/maltose import ATP-binding protein MalK [uncultured archaeon]|nr:Trehalose/maltose import ATP-binding protein MalK [uncultured archaeon]
MYPGISPEKHQQRRILKVEGLSVSFPTTLGSVMAAQDISFDLWEKEILALVGETGCGKSVLASAILRLLPGNAVVSGSVVFGDRDLLCLSEKDISRIRGSQISMVFQNPTLAHNPLIRMEDQIAEPLCVHRGRSKKSSRKLAEKVAISFGLEGGGILKMYPFELSGGMNQRAMISTSVILSPRIIIADEPTKGLDDALARQAIRELSSIKEQWGASLLLITHDLSMASAVSDRMAVMYCGQIVEIGLSSEVFENPLHPYSRALKGCLPENGYNPIPGSSPSLIQPPSGCRYHPRCSQMTALCKEAPPMMAVAKSSSNSKKIGMSGCSDDRHESCGRQVRCWRC